MGKRKQIELLEKENAALKCRISDFFKASPESAILEDMEKYRQEVTASPEKALEFLKRIGVIDENGNRRDLIKD